MRELSGIARIGFALIYSPRGGAGRAGQYDFRAPGSRRPQAGFTLIELSIVLVIIGLIVGGVLTGSDLVEAARIRAQISQIDQYNTAMRTFQNKYGGLPGDLPASVANSAGFPARGQYAGQGDGNGLIQGTQFAPPADNGPYQLRGENVVAWVDLSIAGLLQGNFHTASETALIIEPVTQTTTPSVNDYLPQAKIGNGNYVYIIDGQWDGNVGTSGLNYFGIAPVVNIAGGVHEAINSNGPAMTVQQAYAIDSKVDDGFPLTGIVQAAYENENTVDNFIMVVRPAGGTAVGTFDNNATAPSSSTCYDNKSVNGAAQQYSMGQNGGAGMNCAVMFQFQ